MMNNRFQSVIASVLFMVLAGIGNAQPESQDYTVPFSTAPLLAEDEVQIDGQVNDAEWEAGSRFGDFLVVTRLAADNSETLLNRAERNSQVRVIASERGLVVGLIAETSPLHPIEARLPATERDGNVWEGDSFEVIVYHPDADRGFVAIINPNGALFDGPFRDNPGGAQSVGWEPNIPEGNFAAAVGEDQWSAELLIPWDQLGGQPEHLEVWRFNVKRYEFAGVFSAWAPANDIAGIETSGKLRFRNDMSVWSLFQMPREVGDRVDDVTPPTTIQIMAMYEGQDPQLFMAYTKVMEEVAEGGELAMTMPEFLTTMGFNARTLEVKEVQDFSMGGATTLDRGEYIGTMATARPIPGRQYLVIINIADDDNFDDPLHQQIIPFTWSEPVAFPIRMQRWFLTDGTVKVSVPVLGLPASAADADRLRVVLLPESGEQELAAADGVIGADPVSLDLSEMAFGDYRLRVDVMAGGDVRVSREVPLEKPEFPEWAGNDLGKTDALLPPWEPMAYDGDTVVTTNRTYDFGAGLLPKQVTVHLDRGDQLLLAEPVRLVVNGQALVPRGQPEVLERSDTRYVRTQTFGGGPLTLQVKSTLEYDGFYYMEVEAPEGGTVQSFRLEVPVRAEAGTHYWRGYNGLKPIDQFSAAEWPWGGKLGNEPTEIGFAPTVRLHDLDHGIEFFTEHNWDWRNADERKQIVIQPVSNGVRTLHVNFRGEGGAGEVVAGSRFDFGLIAIPTKPFELPWDEIMLSNSESIRASVHFENITPARYPALWMPGRKVPESLSDGVFVHYLLRDRVDPAGGELALDVDLMEAKEHGLFWLDFGNTTKSEGIHAVAYVDGNQHRVVLRDSGGKQVISPAVGSLNDFRLTWKARGNGTRLTLHVAGTQTPLDSALRPTAEQLRDGILLVGGQGRLKVDRLMLKDSSGGITLDDGYDETFVPNDFRATAAGGTVDRVAHFDKGHLVLDTQVELKRHAVHNRKGVTGVYTHWHARDDFLGPWYEIDGEDRKQQYARYHAAMEGTGVGHDPYFLKNMAIYDPAWADFGAEVSIQPTAISFDHTVAAPSGPGQDFVVWGIHKVLTDMDADYIHLDFGLPFPDAALGTGAGSIGPDGELRFSYPLLAHRELYKRIYKLCIDHDAKFVPHTSPGIEMAYASFAHSGITGEQEEFYFNFNTEAKYEASVRDHLPDGRYLSHYPGILLGTTHYQLSAAHLTAMTGDVMMNWSTYLSQPYGDFPMTEDARAGGNLMRDRVFAPYRAASDQQLRTGNMFTRLATYFYPVFLEFGDAEFIPFFRVQELLGITTSLPQDVFVSIAMQRDAPEALMIVGNFKDANLTATVKFDAARLGVDRPFEVYDPVLKRLLVVDPSGSLTLDVPKEMIRPLIVRPVPGR
ncbi:MAG: glycoside hydrolase domain-containing protein [Planctomycetota bacterium]